PARLLHAGQVRHHVPDGGEAALVLAVPFASAFGYPVTPGLDEMLILAGHAEQLADDVAGQEGSHILDEVDLVTPRHLVEDRCGEFTNVGFEGPDAPWGESPAHQGPQPLVGRVVHRHQVLELRHLFPAAALYGDSLAGTEGL